MGLWRFKEPGSVWLFLKGICRKSGNNHSRTNAAQVEDKDGVFHSETKKKKSFRFLSYLYILLEFETIIKSEANDFSLATVAFVFHTMTIGQRQGLHPYRPVKQLHPKVRIIVAVRYPLHSGLQPVSLQSRLQQLLVQQYFPAGLYHYAESVKRAIGRLWF